MSLSNEIQAELAKESDSNMKQVETPVEHFNVHSKDLRRASNGSSSDVPVQIDRHGVPQLIGGRNEEQEVESRGPRGRKEWFAYIKTKQFWIVLLFGCADLKLLRLQYLQFIDYQIGRSCPSALLAPIPFLRFCPWAEPTFLPFKLSLTTLS